MKRMKSYQPVAATLWYLEEERQRFWIWLILLKSVNSNFTLAVHSPKLGQAKTHFLERKK